MSPLERMAVDLVPCARCGAGLHAHCATTSGVRATRPHAARLRPVYVAWGAGYSDGTTDERDRQEQEAGRA